MAGKKRRKSNLNSGIAILCITVIIVLVAGMVVHSTNELKAEVQTYELREEALNREIQAEADRKEELQDRKDHVTTKQYIEEVAREKLGLLNPDEVLLKENE